MSEEKLPLSRLIQAVTDELHLAEDLTKKRQASGEQSAAIMQFDECEIEMAVDIEFSGKAETNIWVIKLGGGAKRTEANTIKVKFKRLEGRELTFVTTQEGDGPELGPDSLENSK